jgi:hypothetical protein
VRCSADPRRAANATFRGVLELDERFGLSHSKAAEERTMVIVAGHLTVEPPERESYLAGCVSVIEQARGTAGGLDFATADLIDPGRAALVWEGAG